MPPQTHQGHVEPSLLATALPFGLAAIIPLVMFVSSHGFLGESLIALGLWIGFCFWLCAQMECRNATKMGGVWGFVMFLLLLVPYVVALWIVPSLLARIA
jgi:hypothetical protein